LSKIIRWETLPEREYKSSYKYTKHELLAICSEVQREQNSHSTQWAIIRICDTPKAANQLVWLLKQQRIKLPNGDFEFASRDTKVYARFVGN
jgi:hypothetical protein